MGFRSHRTPKHLELEPRDGVDCWNGLLASVVLRPLRVAEELIWRNVARPSQRRVKPNSSPCGHLALEPAETPNCHVRKI